MTVNRSLLCSWLNNVSPAFRVFSRPKLIPLVHKLLLYAGRGEHRLRLKRHELVGGAEGRAFWMEHIAPISGRRYRLDHSLMGRNILILLIIFCSLPSRAGQTASMLLNLLELMSVFKLVALFRLFCHTFTFLKKGSRIYRAISYLTIHHSFLSTSFRGLWQVFDSNKDVPTTKD